MINPQDYALVQEALRQRSGLGTSGAGIQGGMQTAGSPSPMNPMTPPAQPNPATQGTGIPAGSNPSDGAISAMNKAQPGEAQIIVKALISRMNKIPPGQ